jgi:hypothetical protein
VEGGGGEVQRRESLGEEAKELSLAAALNRRYIEKSRG